MSWFEVTFKNLLLSSHCEHSKIGSETKKVSFLPSWNFSRLGNQYAHTWWLYLLLFPYFMVQHLLQGAWKWSKTVLEKKKRKKPKQILHENASKIVEWVSMDASIFPSCHGKGNRKLRMSKAHKSNPSGDFNRITWTTGLHIY